MLLRMDREQMAKSCYESKILRVLTKLQQRGAVRYHQRGAMSCLVTSKPTRNRQPSENGCYCIERKAPRFRSQWVIQNITKPFPTEKRDGEPRFVLPFVGWLAGWISRTSVRSFVSGCALKEFHVGRSFGLREPFHIVE